MIFIILLFGNLLSNKQEPPVTGEFKGFWAATRWTLELRQNNEFKFMSTGHFGRTESSGTFRIENQFLELEPEEESPMEMVFENFKFRIIGDSCLVDIDHGYDYCLTRPEQWCSRRWNLRKMAIVERCLD